MKLIILFALGIMIAPFQQKKDEAKPARIITKKIVLETKSNTLTYFLSVDKQPYTVKYHLGSANRGMVLVSSKKTTEFVFQYSKSEFKMTASGKTYTGKKEDFKKLRNGLTPRIKQILALDLLNSPLGPESCYPEEYNSTMAGVINDIVDFLFGSNETEENDCREEMSCSCADSTRTISCPCNTSAVCTTVITYICTQTPGEPERCEEQSNCQVTCM